MRREVFATLIADTLGDEVEALNDEEARRTAELVSAMIPTTPRSPWAELIGPVYTWRGVAQLLGLKDRQSVDARRNSHRLLGLKTADGAWAYPLAQFDTKSGRANVLNGLDQILTELVTAADGLAATRWLMTNHRELGRRPIDALTEDLELVVKLASEQAGFWSGRSRR